MALQEDWGEPIYVYSRAQALEDGMLADVSATAREAGIRYPVALTSSVVTLCEPPKRSHEDFAGRLWDVLWMLRMAMKRAPGGSDRLLYTVRIGARNVQLKAVVGPGDNFEPVITVSLPEED